MDSSNKRKHIFLGVPYGTACGQLRKMILFDLLVKSNLAICYRCNNRIGSCKELSIDHKEAWEGVSKEKFWDLTNIAFSHLGCNVKAGKKQKGPRRVSKEAGKTWCTGCKDFVLDGCFGPPSKKEISYGRKFRYLCNPCRKKQGWEHRARKLRNGVIGNTGGFDPSDSRFDP